MAGNGKRPLAQMRRTELEGVGQRILSARKAAGLSMRQVVEDIPITASYLSRIERGDRIPALDVLALLAEKVGVSPTWLATGEDSFDLRVTRKQMARLAEGECPRAVAQQARKALASMEG